MVQGVLAFEGVLFAQNQQNAAVLTGWSFTVQINNDPGFAAKSSPKVLQGKKKTSQMQVRIQFCCKSLAKNKTNDRPINH